MSTDAFEEHALQFLLGSLSPTDQAAFAAALEAEPHRKQFVSSLSEVLLYLAASTPPLAPPASAKERLMARIQKTPQGAAPAQPAVHKQPQALNPALDSLSWQASEFPGVSTVTLREEPGQAALLIRVEPGCSFPDHHHIGPEHCLVLRGCLTDAGGDHLAGQFVYYGADTRHSDLRATGNEVCIVFVVHTGVEFGTKN